MDRYDWEWSRRDPRGSGYDGGYRRGWWPGGAAWRGRYSSGGGGSAYDGRRGMRYEGLGMGGGGRYRYSYGRPGGGGYGRVEPWQAGPPGGYGAQWGAAYGRGGDSYDRGYGYDRFRQGRPQGGSGPYDRSGAFDPFGGDAYADLPDAPRGYYDGYDPDLDDEPPPSDDRLFRHDWPGDEPDDNSVREGVTRSLRDDGFIDADAIRVEVKDRVVTLRGEVKDYLEARYAWDDAWDARGVRGVISKLTVGGAGGQTEPAAAAKKKR